MPVNEFRCPQCSTRLRCRDRSWVGRRIQCPDCGATVLIAAGSDGKLSGTAPHDAPRAGHPPDDAGSIDAGSAGTRAFASPPDQAADSLAQINRRRPLRERLLSPAGIGWIVACGIGLLLVGGFLMGPRPDGGDDAPATIVDDPDPGTVDDSGGDRVDPVERSVEDQLVAIYDWVKAYIDDHEELPAVQAEGLEPGERFSWLAVLVAKQPEEQALQPQWDRAWDHQSNDRFVRRQIEILLNPNLEQSTGTHGYPATHFAGVAGVGADAADLPGRHPRAGIFGNDRTATLDDISDGLANTMMVAGVQQDLSSWAAAGAGTVRPFTREPYVNGPDGFGTGQEDGMFMLMADGSVRFVSSQTDPRLIRRMAAMADGLPLDSSVPGEPGDSASVESPQLTERNVDQEMSLPPDPFAGLVDDETPIDVYLAIDLPILDVAGALEFPVAGYVQSTPVSLLDLLYQWEEMAGVPIDASPLDDDPTAFDRLQQEVTLTLSETTLGEILAELLAQAGLRYETGSNAVWLHVVDPL